MELPRITSILDNEFDIENVHEDWSDLFDRQFIKKAVPKFRTPMHNTGLMIANSTEVNKIYTAFSPSRYVLEEIHMRGVVNVLLVVKSPFDWDGRKNSKGFLHFEQRDYQLMEGMGISIYSLHTPLDKNRNDNVVSAAHGFAKAIKLRYEEEFAHENNNPGMRIGLIGKMPEGKISALVKRLNALLDYKVKVRKVNDYVGKTAIITGDGFKPEFMNQAKDRGVNTFITGVITPNASEYCRKNYKNNLAQVNKIGINVIGCSHYLTQKWAMQYSLPYFSRICKSEFIEDKEALNLLE